MSFERSELRLTVLVLFGLLSLSASGLAGAHGAPDAENLPEGIVKARITESPSIPGLNALILDGPRPGIMLRYQGPETMTVLGSEGEPFLQFTNQSVKANTQSVSWKRMPNRQVSDDHDGWLDLSGSGTFGWIDPRLNSPEISHGDKNQTRWSIPVRMANGEVQRIAGTLTYRPIVQVD